MRDCQALAFVNDNKRLKISLYTKPDKVQQIRLLFPFHDLQDHHVWVDDKLSHFYIYDPLQVKILGAMIVGSENRKTNIFLLTTMANFCILK